MSNVYFGIDIGTSQCSVAYVVDTPRIRGDKTITPDVVKISQDTISASPSDRFPSILGADFSDRRRQNILFGWDFLALLGRKRRTALPPLRRGRDFFYSAKSDMGTNRVYPFSEVPQARTPVEVTARLLEQLVRLVKHENAALDLRTGHVAITVPASFSTLAREDTLEAARQAGFTRDRVSLLDEPVAALLDSVNHQATGAFLTNQFQTVLMFDYGGGTCDLALMSVRLYGDHPLGIQVVTLAISPYLRLGGDDIDRAVMDKIVWPMLGVDDERERLSTSQAESIRDTLTITVARRLKEQLCAHVQHLLRKNEGKWTDLRRIHADVPAEVKFSIPGMSALPKSYSMTAEEFEHLVMGPFVACPDDFDDEEDCRESLLRPVWQTLQKAELEFDDLDRLILNGASSLNPFVRRMLDEQFGEGKPMAGVTLSHAPSVTTSVARGAALACYWEHARGQQLIAPIMPDDLGVIVQRAAPVTLVAAGERLPYPGADDVHAVRGELFVPPDCGPEMLVPYFTGHDGPERKPRHAGTVKVPIPAGTSPGTDVTVRLRVDADKTLQWWFSLGAGDAAPAASVKDPWTQRVLTADERALAEHRRVIRQTMDSGKKVTSQMLLTEANRLRLAGHAQESIVLVNDIMERDGGSGQAFNIRALAWDALEEPTKALSDFKHAADMAPDIAIYRGNYGCSLQEANRLEEAVAAIRLALQINGSLGYLHERLATVSRLQGREDDAQRELRQAAQQYQKDAEANPLTAYSWWQLARVRHAVGDYEGAERAATLAHDAAENDRLGGSGTDVVSGIKEVVSDEEAI